MLPLPAEFADKVALLVGLLVGAIATVIVMVKLKRKK